MGYLTKSMQGRLDNISAAQPAYAYGANPNDDDYASKINAGLARADYEDYKKTFRPVHERFINAVTTDDLTNEQLGRVRGNVDDAFARGNEANAAMMGRMGLSAVTSPDQDIAKSLAVASAENNIRDYSKQRSETLMGGSSLTQVKAAE